MLTYSILSEPAAIETIADPILGEQSRQIVSVMAWSNDLQLMKLGTMPLPPYLPRSELDTEIISTACRLDVARDSFMSAVRRVLGLKLARYPSMDPALNGFMALDHENGATDQIAKHLINYSILTYCVWSR